MGAGYFRRKQVIKGILVTIVQVTFILFTIMFAMSYVPKFGTLGTVQREVRSEHYWALTVNASVDREQAEADAMEAGAKAFEYDEENDPEHYTVLTPSTPKQMKAVRKALAEKGYEFDGKPSEVDRSYENEWDHSFKILLFSVVSFVVFFFFLIFWMRNVVTVRHLELDDKHGRHINSFKDDVRALFNERFYQPLLALPLVGIVVFVVMPLIVIILVAFTNYNDTHMPPNQLFTWIGFENFRALLSGSSQKSSFGYSFKKIFSWTLIWSVLATFTNFFAGIALAMLINNKHTKCKKVWRTAFIVAMAVPQFISLLLVRNFFANEGIVNTICSNLGITAFFQKIGLVQSNLNYIPFLTKSGWAKVMIVLINIWIGVPYQLLIATGILMNIPQEQYEAATIDGANHWQQFWKITMPYMFFVMGPTLISDVVKNINNFNVIYLLQEGVYTTTDMKMASSQANETDLLVTWLFRLTQGRNQYDMASTIGILIFVVSAVITLIAFNTVMKGNREESFQ
jgi:arabinogalactan oligomer/maltooligosaccharide transport system permease protein